jgi:hypothetical protein
MTYLADSGQKLRLHGHLSNQTCHWAAVFKPVAFIVFHNPVLIKSLSSSYGKSTKLDAIGDAEYAEWLCKYDERGFLNLLNVLLHVCELRGIP